MAPSNSEQAELRELQRKAYGRDGGLTEAEARRLRELERAVVAPAAVAHADAAAAVGESPPVAEIVEERVTPSRQDVAAESAPWSADDRAAPSDRPAGARGGADGIRALLRAQWRVVASPLSCCSGSASVRGGRCSGLAATTSR